MRTDLLGSNSPNVAKRGELRPPPNIDASSSAFRQEYRCVPLGSFPVTENQLSEQTVIPTYGDVRRADWRISRIVEFAKKTMCPTNLRGTEYTSRN